MIFASSPAVFKLFYGGAVLLAFQVLLDALEAFVAKWRCFLSDVFSI